MKRLTFVAIVLLAAAPAILLAQGQPDRVADVRVRGNERLTDAAVLNMVRTRVGAAYEEQIVQADERRLLESGRFETVAVEKTDSDDGIIVTFVVNERPAVTDLRIVGNSEISTSELLREVPLGPGDALNRYSIESARQGILNLYRGKGYAFAEVTVDAQALADSQVVYRITEGPRTRIAKIRFQGAESFGRLKLGQQIGSSARFWPFVTGNLDLEQIEQDVQALRNFYINEGFLDVEVGRLPIDFNEDRSRATLTFLVDEGPRYKVNEVIFRGNEVFSQPQLRERLNMTGGEYYTALGLRRDLERLRDTYGEVGFIEAQVASERQYPAPADEPTAAAEAPGLVNVVYTIREGSQYSVGAIDIRGNEVTQERVIRRELQVQPGQLYNAVAMDNSRQRLLESRLFERVEITPLGQAPAHRDVLVEIAEGRTGNFIVGAGVSSNSGLLGNITFQQRNFDLFGWPESWRQFATGKAFKGAGQTLRVVAEPGTELMRFSVDWFEPYLFDRPYSLANRAFLFERGREAYDEQRIGDIVSLGHRFPNRWYAQLAQRIEGVEMDADFDAPIEVREDDGDHLLLSTKGSLTRDRTDSRWMPSRGDRFEVSYEQIYGDYTFGALEAEYRIYRTLYVDPLDRKHIIAGRFSAGRILGDSPVFERFYGGGIGSVRGFEYRGISPRGTGSDDPIGGEMELFAGAEYSFPILGEQLRGVVFLDTGTVEEGSSISTYRASVGMGLRWVVPIFGPLPLSLDFGFPIAKDDDDETQLVSFSFGWTF
jgi:outer membrane protein insertion porin family